MAKKQSLLALPTSLTSILRIVGIVLLCHGFAVALTSKSALKPQFHNVESADLAIDTSAGSGSVAQGLPVFATIEILVAALLVIVSQSLIAANGLMQIRRKEVAGSVGRYDHASFSGVDFVHFKHRGAVAQK